MKYKNELVIISIMSILILFLKKINVLQIENHLGHPLGMILLIILCSAISISFQKNIDQNYKNGLISYQNLDILKYISSIFIMILHLRPFINFSNELDLTFNNIITRICVPIFFVITGYFVAKKEMDHPEYIKSYIKKLIPLYLFWSLLYVPVIITTAMEYLPLIGKYLSMIHLSFPLAFLLGVILLPIIILIALVYTGVYYHLWYFPAVIASLLVLEKWKKRHSIQSLLIISFGLLLFGATETYYGVLPYTIKQLLSYYYHIFFTTRNFLFFGLFYVVLGYIMGTRKEVYSKYCFEKLIVSVFLLIVETILLHDTERLNSNILLSCVPLVYYLFISVIYMTNHIKTKFPFRNLSKYYYLLHPMIIFFLFTLGIINVDTSPYLQIGIVLLVTHIVATIILKFKQYQKVNV